VRLNGWQQIGALASVVWVLVGPVYLINKDTHHATKQASLAMRACYKAGRKDCLKVYDTTMPRPVISNRPGAAGSYWHLFPWWLLGSSFGDSSRYSAG
jgi:hypothetical protein